MIDPMRVVRIVHDPCTTNNDEVEVCLCIATPFVLTGIHLYGNFNIILPSERRFPKLSLRFRYSA